MGMFYGTHEIVELEEESEHESSFVKPGKKFYIEDDINRLFESIRVSARASGLPHLQKKSMKRPMRVGPYQPSGIGISQPVSLKQALRGLSISQASEMAATKRLSKPSGFSPAPEAWPVKISCNNNQNGLFTGLTELGQTRNLKLKLSSLSTRASKKLPMVDETVPVPITQETGRKPELIKNQVTSDDLGPGPSTNLGMEITEIKRRRNIINKSDDKSRSREKGEFSQSSKSSIGRCSSSTSFSCESNLSVFRPHMSKDSRWEAVKHNGICLNLQDFKLIKKIGGGDIGTVYLAELIGSNCLFALKILNNELLAVKKKAIRAQTEREILQLLDHPFLPTLFSQFTTDKYSCLVIEYCPGGDLHVLRQKQPNKCFSEQAARFYIAETLLALEYLHMLGIIYRDLKPENILVREDGHIMLTDFDLSLRCDPNPNPTLLNPPSPPTPTDPSKPTEPSCIDPFFPCFSSRLQPTAPNCPHPKPNPTVTAQMPQISVEPTTARSNSFVGTHEYLAPEIIKSDGHGSSVDWWTFGILLYELLYGFTPFKGATDDDTLANVVSRGLEFPDSPIVSSRARDLIRGLLKKRPENRLGSVNGAVEIRRHPFFEGLNWALIRCAVPPEVPKVLCLKNFEKEVKVFDMF